MRIAPSILAADFTRLGEQIAAAEAAGADQIHIDVMDGRFVPNITMGPLVVEAARRVTRLPLDVHLMIVEPERHLDAFARAGADMLTVHVEASPHLHRTLQYIRSLGCGAGVALNPHTPIMMIEHVADLLDLVLMMTVNPGFGGQSFIAATLPKIAAAAALLERQGRDIALSVDGGIDASTASLVLRAGANTLVAGTAIFGAAEGIMAAVMALRAAEAQPA